MSSVSSVIHTPHTHTHTHTRSYYMHVYIGYVPSVSRPAQASKWEAYGGYDPKKLSAPTPSAAASSAPAQAPAPVKAEARATSSTDTLSSAPTKKWTPPIGYVPRRQGEQGKIRSWNSPAGYVPGWTSQMGDFPGWSSPSAGANGGDALGRSPAKKWEAYGGYDPKKLSAPTPSAAASKARAQASAPVKTEARATSSTDTLSSAPANKWQPYGGYDPKNRGASGIRTASASMAEQAYQPPAVAVKSSIVPGKNWESYGGYDPKYRKTVAAEVAPAASTRSVATSSSTTTPLNSAPAKKWQPYGGGYDPKKRGGYDPKNRGRPTPSAAGSASAANPSPARSTVTLAWGDQVLAEFERSRSPSSPPRGFSPGRPVQVVILIILCSNIQGVSNDRVDTTVCRLLGETMSWPNMGAERLPKGRLPNRRLQGGRLRRGDCRQRMSRLLGVTMSCTILPHLMPARWATRSAQTLTHAHTHTHARSCTHTLYR